MRKKLTDLVLALMFPALYIAMQLLLQWGAQALVLYGLLAYEQVEAALNWISLAGQVLTLLVIVGVFHMRGMRMTRFVGMGPMRGRHTPGTLVVLGLSFNMLSTLLVEVIPLPQTMLDDYQSQVTDNIYKDGAVVALLIILVFAPFFEEIIFRGLVMTTLRRSMNWTAVIWIQAVIFALFHFNALQIIYVLPAGLMMGYIYKWSGTLRACIVFHFAYNLGGPVLSLLLGARQLEGWALWGLIALMALLTAASLDRVRGKLMAPAA